MDFEGKLTIEGKEVRLNFDDFFRNDFSNLENFLTVNEIDDLIKELDLRILDKIYYKDKNGLSVVYCQKKIIENKSCLIILSFGESQPARYRIFALGAAILDQNSNIP